MIEKKGYVLVAAVLVVFSAVAQNPDETARPAFLERAQSQQEEGVTVTVAVPSAGETQELFGVPLYRRKIQPVWLEVTNERETPIMFLPVGVDPEYFTPIESAFLGAGGARKASAAMGKSFLDERQYQ